MIPGGLNSMLMGVGGGGLSVPSVDFTELTEVDPGSDIALATSSLTFTSLPRNVSAYAYKQYDDFVFTGNFTIDFTVNATFSTSGFADLVGVRDDVGSADAAQNKIVANVFESGGSNLLRIVELVSGAAVVDSMVISNGTDYFCRLIKDTSVGANGTAFLHVASSSANRDAETWIDTLSITLAANNSYQYFYGIASFNSGITNSISGVVSDASIEAD